MNKQQMVEALVPFVARTKRVTKQSAESALNSLELQVIRAIYMRLVPVSVDEKQLSIESIVKLLDCTAEQAERLKLALKNSTAEELLRTAGQIERAKHQQHAQAAYEEQERKDFEVFKQACRVAFDTGGPAISAILSAGTHCIKTKSTGFMVAATLRMSFIVPESLQVLTRKRSAIFPRIIYSSRMRGKLVSKLISCRPPRPSTSEVSSTP